MKHTDIDNNTMTNAEHARLIALLMLSMAPPLIESDALDDIYSAALIKYQVMIGKVGKYFQPVPGFKKAVIDTIKTLLPKL
jgi:hypothetical protein